MKRINTLAILVFIEALALTPISAQIDHIGIAPESTEYRYTNYKHAVNINSPNYAKTKELNGGNYLSLGYSYHIIPKISVGANFIADLVPNTFDDQLAETNLRFYTNVTAKEFQSYMGLFYMRNFKNDVDFTGVRFSLINYAGNKLRAEFFPFSVIYSLSSSKVSFGYEYIAFSILF